MEEDMNKKRQVEYYRNFVLGPSSTKKKKPTYEDYEIQISHVPVPKPPLSQNEANLQDLQIRKMNQLNKQVGLYKDKFETLMSKVEEVKFKVGNNYVCKNDKLLDSLAPHLLNCYTVYSDEISESLLDELLYDEVEFLNGLEEFKANLERIEEKTDENHEPLNQERDPLENIPSRLIKLLKTLDDYATE